MKKAMKVLGILLCAVLLVVGSVAATLAYLTAKTERVTNTFTVGDVAITLTEAKTDINGQPMYGENKVDSLEDAERRSVGNTYHLVPGYKFYKDPTVSITAGSDSAYVRMLVEMKGAEWTDLVGLTDFNDTVWSLANEGAQPDVNGVVVYEFRYNGTKTSGDLEPLFTYIDLSGDGITGESGEYVNIKDITAINVEAHAIQKESFTDAATAWAAFTAEGALEATEVAVNP